MPCRAGLGVAPPVSPGSDAIPHLWLAARDSRKFVRVGGYVGTQLAQLQSNPNADIGSTLKLSTGTLFWSGGIRVPVPGPMAEVPRPSLWQRLRYGAAASTSPAAAGTASTAPSGTRFGVRGSGLTRLRQAQVQGNGHRSWGLSEPHHVKGTAFISQHLPLPIGSGAGGASWLKVKVHTPSSSCFILRDGSTRNGPEEDGRLNASVNLDSLVGRDYSKLSVGLQSRYRPTPRNDGLVLDQTPLEVYTKVQHNKQLLKATWQRKQGVRVFFNKAF